MVKKIPTTLEKHGHVRVDDYYWLREQDNPEAIAYLKGENEYAEKAMAHTKRLEDKLFEEIKARFKQTDTSVPYRRDDYFYYTRYEEGREYPIYARKRGSSVGSGQDLLAYAVDTQGRRVYTTCCKNLTTSELFSDVIPEVTENLAWANDNKTLFYAKQDPTTLRAYRNYRHLLGTDIKND